MTDSDIRAEQLFQQLQFEGYKYKEIRRIANALKLKANYSRELEDVEMKSDE